MYHKTKKKFPVPNVMQLKDGLLASTGVGEKESFKTILLNPINIWHPWLSHLKVKNKHKICNLSKQFCGWWYSYKNPFMFLLTLNLEISYALVFIFICNISRWWYLISVMYRHALFYWTLLCCTLQILCSYT